MNELSKEEARRIAMEAARQAVQDTFRLLGVDISDQRQLNEFRADLVQARKLRRTIERGGGVAFGAIVAAVTIGVIGFVWGAFKSHIGGG